jgi:hypothetical protein
MAMDFTFEQTIDRGTKNCSTLLVKENRLINCADGWIELYSIESDGSLTLLDYIQSYAMVTPAQLFEGTLYVADTIIEMDSRIRAISLEQDELTVIRTLIVPPAGIGDLINRLEVSEDYLMYGTNFSGTSSYVLDRLSFDLRETIPATYFCLYQNYLFEELTNGIECMLQIKDITDIYNPVIVSQYILGPFEYFRCFKIYGDTLFIAKETEVNIISIADIANPVVIGNISNIPYVHQLSGLFDIEKHGNDVIITNNFGDVWVYDVSNLYQPQMVAYCNTIVDFSGCAGSMALWNSSLYLTGNYSPILQLDCNAIPDFTPIGTYGSTAWFTTGGFMDDWYVYVNNNHEIRFQHRNDPLSEPGSIDFGDCLAKVLIEDSAAYAFKFIDNDLYADSLYIIEDTGDNLQITAGYDISDLFIREAYKTGSYFAGISHNNTQLGFYQLSNNGLELAHQTSQTGMAYIHKQPDDLQYLYCLRDNHSIVRVEKEPPFAVIETCNISGFGTYPIMYMLNDERGIVVSNTGEITATISLVALDDAMNLTVLDQADAVCDGTVGVTDDFFYTAYSLGSVVNCFHWQNDELELFYEYDFEHLIHSLTFDPQNEMVYCLGYFNAELYSYQPTAADPQLAPLPAVSLSNYPNPFNPSTEIRFQMSDASQLEHAQIEIFNIKGQKVKAIDVTLSLSKCGAENSTPPSFDKLRMTRAGSCQSFSVTWDGTDSANQPVASGVYLYQLRAGKQTLAQKKMMLLK